ncbi:MAG TPA: hypothetical protein VIB48_10740 [Acidimicrobiia bacterium]
MRDRRHLARLALDLVEGCVRNDPAADSLLADAFDSAEEAAAAHAYLTGFVLQALAQARTEPVEVTAGYVRRLLGSPAS